jgi:DNA-binding GntR family transcriptional regulator
MNKEELLALIKRKEFEIEQHISERESILTKNKFNSMKQFKIDPYDCVCHTKISQYQNDLHALFVRDIFDDDIIKEYDQQLKSLQSYHWLVKHYYCEEFSEFFGIP